MTLRQADSVTSAERLQGPSMARWGFRADIEGLRAVAVLAVVLFHAEVPGISGGFVGVDVFFVISGFLITGLLWREVSTSGTVRLSSFYGARARRLLPASATVGVVTMVGAAILLPALQAHAAMGDGIASALYVSNYWFILRGVDYFASNLPPSPFEHYWSLGVEEQFYLVWAPMILAVAWLVRRRRRRSESAGPATARPFLLLLAAVATLSFILSFVATYVLPAAAYFSLPTRAWQLALGGMIALTAGHWRRLSAAAATAAGWTGLACIVVACFVLSPATLYPGTAALLPTLGAVLLIGAGCAVPSRGCGRLLAMAPLRAIGRVSYSWYLWHWPVLIFAPLIVGHSLGLAGRLAAAFVSLGLAVLTLRYIENPLRFSPMIRGSGWRSLGLGAVSTGMAVCVGAALLIMVPTPVGRGVPAAPLAVTAAAVPAGSDIASYNAAVRQAFSEVQSVVEASSGLESVPSNLDPSLTAAPAEADAVLFGGCLRTPFQSGQPECASGDTGSSTTVALVGDSHAAMWNPALRTVAEQRQWRLETLTKGACPLMDLSITNPLRRLLQLVQHCEQWRTEIMERLRVERPELIVLSMWRGYGAEESLTGFTAYDSAWIDSLVRLVHELRDTGAKVLVLGPVPNPQSSVPICLSGNLDDVAACSPARSTAVNESGVAVEAAATEAAGGHYADVTDLFCTEQRCQVIVGNTLVYFDSYHLTIEYSGLLAPVVGALADRAIAQG